MKKNIKKDFYITAIFINNISYYINLFKSILNVNLAKKIKY